MSDNFDRLLNTSERANVILHWLTEQIQSKRVEFDQTEFYKTYSKSAVSKLPLLSKRAVDSAVEEMEATGYEFGKRQGGASTQYAMTIQNVIDIYAHRGIKPYREKRGKAFVIFVVNLKGGVSKTVSTVTMAHGMRTHQSLLHEDLRILVIDLDPQASSTMFLNHHHSIGLVNNSSAQAMLTKDLTREEILEEFVQPSIVPGVDIIPASIEFTGKAGITSLDVRQVDPAYNPSVRGEATKTDYIRAIDTIIESRGEKWIIPLSKAVITAMFPAVHSGTYQRLCHREKIATARSDRSQQKQKREQMSASENAQSSAWVELQFCQPGEHKAWLAQWRDELEMAGVSDWELRRMLTRWWSGFWIASARTDWRWCDTLYDLLNEMDYVISTSCKRDLWLCRSALPINIPFLSDRNEIKTPTINN